MTLTYEKIMFCCVNRLIAAVEHTPTVPCVHFNAIGVLAKCAMRRAACGVSCECRENIRFNFIELTVFFFFGIIQISETWYGKGR